jgi:hypothetical protein
MFRHVLLPGNPGVEGLIQDSAVKPGILNGFVRDDRGREEWGLKVEECFRTVVENGGERWRVDERSYLTETSVEEGWSRRSLMSRRCRKGKRKRRWCGSRRCRISRLLLLVLLLLLHVSLPLKATGIRDSVRVCGRARRDGDGNEEGRKDDVSKVFAEISSRRWSLFERGIRAVDPTCMRVWQQ